MSANTSSESVEWYTPEKYIESARAAMGGIDLDPASCEAANETVKATEFWTAEDDPIEPSKDWHGRVFMNPPYGKTEKSESLAFRFCEKVIAEYALGHVEQAIILVNLLPSQGWQFQLYDGEVCLVKRRIQFISGDGEKNENPTQQNLFLYLGDEDGFAREFKKHGYMMQAMKFEN